MKIRIIPNEGTTPAGKLADAELHFSEGPLAGLKLIGFAIWERRGGAGRNVTFPARQYSVNGERRAFALLRPIATVEATDRLRDLILDAYATSLDPTPLAEDYPGQRISGPDFDTRDREGRGPRTVTVRRSPNGDELGRPRWLLEVDGDILEVFKTRKAAVAGKATYLKGAGNVR